MPAPRSAQAATVRGFTRTDLLVAIAAAAVLAAAVVAPLRRARDQAQLRQCAGNLQQVNRAVLQFAEEHHHFRKHAIRYEPHPV